MHAEYGRRLGYSASDIAALELTPSKRAYQNHMVASAACHSLLEGVAALTPCPWLYVDLGQHFVHVLGGIPEQHPFRDWLKMYSDLQFVAFVEEPLSRLKRFAIAADSAARERAKHAFSTSVRYEWLFWQQAWELRWPV